jgi:mannose-6-phosphate isomerase-like protein (cupin superfamily)
MTGFLDNIEKLTLGNDAFRKVLYTGQHLQLVVMSLAPNEEIGLEVHSSVDQFFRIEAGEGKLTVAGQERSVMHGDAFVVPAGSEHNVVNASSSKPLKLYTIYSPPQHKSGTVHKTKQDAREDEEG